MAIIVAAWNIASSCAMKICCRETSCLVYHMFTRHHIYHVIFCMSFTVHDAFCHRDDRKYGQMSLRIAESVNCFKNRLDNFWKNQIIYNFRAEIYGTGNRSEVPV